MDKLGPLNSDKFYVCLPEGLPLSLQQGVQNLLHICRLSQQLFNSKFMYSSLSGEPALFRPYLKRKSQTKCIATIEYSEGFADASSYLWCFDVVVSSYAGSNKNKPLKTLRIRML